MSVPSDTKIGLIDIGSSSIRLVIYRAGGRLPHPQFNEREICGLGAGVGETGVLAPRRVAHALETLRRFAVIAKNSDLDRLDVFATEAVRRARNQDAFIKPAEKILGRKIRILSGGEEARYAALGVVRGFNGVDGVVGDLGGGSLELQPVKKSRLVKTAKAKDKASLPLGHLNALKRSEIKKALARLGWLEKYRGRNFYAVGGTWRAIATTITMRSKGELDIVHGLTLSPRKLAKVMAKIAEADGEVAGIPPARRGNMRQAIKVLGCLMQILKPKAIVFSGYGVREGILYEKFITGKKDSDQLIEGVTEYSDVWARHPGFGKTLLGAMKTFIALLPHDRQRLARAAALLADIAWIDFPDYRGRLAVEKMLGLSVVGIDHEERIWMAAVLYIRYHGHFPRKGIFRGRLSREARASATYIGLVLRMLINATGGLPILMKSLEIKKRKNTITISLPGKSDALISPLFIRRLEAVQKYCPAKIKII